MPEPQDNNPKSADTDNNLLWKILRRLGAILTASEQPVSIGSVTLDASDIEIGAVELKDGTTNTRAAILTAAPAAGDPGVVVRVVGGGGGLTDAELRAVAVPVSSAQLPAALIGGRLDVNLGSASGALPVTGPLTDAELRATAVPISGTITAVTAITNALPAGNNNIGDVDMASVPAPLSTTGGGTEATALRVTVANDSTGVLSVDDNGGSLTVDGVVSSKTALTASGPTAASVGVASAQAVAAAATRKGLVLVNTSSAVISLGFGSAAVLASGITLNPGDSFTMDEYTFHTGAVNAIASIAASNLAIQEYTT